MPPGFEQIGDRPFSFYPPVINIEHNEWNYRKATWSEVLVSNAKTELEVWIPRGYIGAFSRIEEPVVIIGLTKELEYKGGQVWPYIRRVIEMPRAVNDSFRPSAEERAELKPGAMLDIRREGGTESRIWRLLVVALAVGVAVSLAVVLLLRSDRDGSRIVYSPVVQSELGLSAQDDYHAIVRKLGTPAEDRWRADEGAVQYRLLRFPKHGISVVLMGSERGQERYIGAVNPQGRPVHSVTLAGGTTTDSLLRSLNVK